MASSSEVGHAKNVANLQKLIERITTFTLYNPPIPIIGIPNLVLLHTAANAKLIDVETSRTANKAAIYDRQVVFEKLKPLSTRIINLLDILNLSPGLFSQATSYNDAIQGGSKQSAVPPPPDGDGVSNSRQSFTQQAEIFGNFLILLESIPTYTPNEDDLKLPNLITYHESLVAATKPVDRTEAEFKEKLRERNELLYKDEIGIYDIAQDVKKYVKSVYGGNSPEYFNVSSIKFTNPK